MGPDILSKGGSQCHLATLSYCKSPEVVLWMPGWAIHFCQMIYISLKALGECRVVAIFWRDMIPKAGHIDCLSGGGKGGGVLMFGASESEIWKFVFSSPVGQKFTSQPKTTCALKHLYCTLCLLWLSFSQIIIFCLFSRTLDTVLLQTGPESKLFSTASTGVRQSARVQSPVLRQIGSGSESFLTKFTPEKEDLFLMLRVKETLT